MCVCAPCARVHVCVHVLCVSLSKDPVKRDSYEDGHLAVVNGELLASEESPLGGVCCELGWGRAHRGCWAALPNREPHRHTLQCACLEHRARGHVWWAEDEFVTHHPASLSTPAFLIFVNPQGVKCSHSNVHFSGY